MSPEPAPQRQRSAGLDGTVDLARDRDLVERCQGGDRTAFEELYHRYHRRLFHFCLRRLHEPYEAEDAVQEAFTKAWRALPRFAGERRFYPWLTVIAGNVCTDILRRRSRLTPVDDVPLPLVDVDSRDVDELVLREVDTAMVVQALGRLSDRHQRVLQLREGSGWTTQQLAEHEGVAVPAMETLLWRARQALKREFAALAETGGRLGIALGLGGLALRRFAYRTTARVADRVPMLQSVRGSRRARRLARRRRRGGRGRRGHQRPSRPDGQRDDADGRRVRRAPRRALVGAGRAGRRRLGPTGRAGRRVDPIGRRVDPIGGHTGDRGTGPGGQPRDEPGEPGLGARRADPARRRVGDRSGRLHRVLGRGQRRQCGFRGRERGREHCVERRRQRRQRGRRRGRWRGRWRRVGGEQCRRVGVVDGEQRRDRPGGDARPRRRRRQRRGRRDGRWVGRLARPGRPLISLCG